MAYAFTYDTLVTQIANYTENNSTVVAATIPVFILFGQRRIAREIKILGMQEQVLGSFTADNGIIVKPARWLQTVSMNYGTGGGTVISASVTNAGNGLYQFPPTITTSGGGGSGVTFNTFVNNGYLSQIDVNNPGSGYTSAPILTVVPSAVDLAAGADEAAAECTVQTENNDRVFILPRSYEYCRTYWPISTQEGAPKFYADYDTNHWLIVPTPASALPIEILYYQILQPLDSDNQTNWLTENAPDLLLYACLLETTPYLKNDERIPVWQQAYDRAKAGFVTQDEGLVAGRETTRVNRSMK